MTERTDNELLAEFVGTQSETAFAALVARYVNLVYSAALRFTRNPHQAEEITQVVFMILAQKARSLGRNVVLSGWLYQTARFTAANVLKNEIRRQRREQEAYMQSTLNEAASDQWEQMAPWLDEAMGELGESDRNAILLRFFENKSALEVAGALKIKEEAAHKRVRRALEKLRKIFLKRGVVSTTSVIAGMVSANSIQAAPASLALTATAATAKGAAVGGSITALMNATLKAMAWVKVKFALGVAASVLVAGGVAVAIVNGKNEPPANPVLARQILQAVFGRISAPLPAQMRFVSESEVVNKPWTEEQVRAEVQRQEDETRKREGQIKGLRDEDWAKMPKKAQEQRKRSLAELNAIRAESTRRYHGTRTFIQQEWLSGGLWRLDQTETTPQSEILRKLDEPLPPGMVYEKTMVNVNDPSFAPLTSGMLDHRLRAVWGQNSHWTQEKSWEAATLESHFAFLLTFALSDMVNTTQLLKAKPKAEKDIDSFAGVTLDTNKLEALATGHDGRWTVVTEETVLNGRKLAVLRLKGKTISLAHGEEVAFFVDPNHATNIYRIELTGMPLIKTPYISIRDDFDTNGFPHTWIVETPTETTQRKTMKFKEVEMNATFENKEVFQLQAPAGYKLY
ncbi:MAG: polymerase, sigma-24 subunit, subfamily [Verrucomicrobiales bacterium]|nr:polymerase, sigma-24 subunit, subfamily [Verrucomicrobiales bacterium]